MLFSAAEALGAEGQEPRLVVAMSMRVTGEGDRRGKGG